MSLPSGRRLGPYEILSPLGAGGMGEVLKAKDTRLQRTVAVKILPSELSFDAERRERFEREARSASALNHPNITTVYDVGEDEGTHYIVMELVEGKTLRELLDEGPLPTGKLLLLATQIAEGLSKAHGAGIVHRDLKPENLMVTEDGLVKILDFGLAKLMPQSSDADSQGATETRVTQQGVFLGTVPYMSPEQAASRPLDYRSDQFSLGSILYEMATGRRAFKKDTMPQTLAAIIEDDPEPMSKLNAGIPVELPAIVGRCLAKDPAGRYESTGDLARDLKAVPETPSRGRARRRILWAAAGLFVALLVAALGPRLTGLRDRLSSRGGPGVINSIAVLPFENLSGDPEQDPIAEGIHDALITDLAGLGLERVIARRTVMRFKGQDTPLRQIARELNVRRLITGSVVSSGDRVRVTAQLIDPATEAQEWARSYERDLRNILSLQSAVVSAITRELNVQLTPQQEIRLASAPPVDPAAHVAYLKGRSFLNKLTPEGIEKGLAYMQEAIDKDPTNPLPHAGLALAYCLIGHGPSPPPDVFSRAKAAALKAEELGGTLAETEAALGSISLYLEWDWAGAERSFQRALALNPSLSDAHRNYSWYLVLAGRKDEALAEMKRAIEVDPLAPLWTSDLGWQHWMDGRYEEAMDAARKTLELDPSFDQGIWLMGLVLSSKGMHEEAIAAHQKLSTLSPAWRWPLVRTYVLADRREEARKLLDRLLAMEPKPTGAWDGWFLAGVYAALGEKDEAFRWLEAAFEERNSLMPWTHVVPQYAPLRSDPRFQDMLRRMNLPTTSGRPGSAPPGPASRAAA